MNILDSSEHGFDNMQMQICQHLIPSDDQQYNNDTRSDISMDINTLLIYDKSSLYNTLLDVCHKNVVNYRCSLINSFSSIRLRFFICVVYDIGLTRGFIDEKL